MSNLIEKLKEIDLGNGRLSDEEGSYLTQHIVPDRPQNFSAVKIVFLVESPHIKEVRYGYPLAGTSGHNVTEDLIFSSDLHTERDNLDDIDRNTSIGKLVKESKIPWLAIMNVSLLPLQKIAYEDATERCTKMRTLWCAFEDIKSKIEKSHREELCPISGNVYEIIVDDLACRIRTVIGICQPKFIPFGNIARRSLCRVKRNLQCLLVSDVKIWHPSRWRDECDSTEPNPNYNLRERHLESVASDIRNHLTCTR